MSVERDAGVAAFEQGDFATAITQLEAATRQEPGDFQAHLYLGAAYGQSDRQMDAVNMLTQAVTIEPANAKARYNLGIAMEKAGYKEQAIAVLQQAVMLQPDYTKAQEALQRLTGAPVASPQYPPPNNTGTAPGYGQPASPNQTAAYSGGQNNAPVETGSPLPTNRPWPTQPAQNSNPSPYPAQPTYQGQQSYPAQQTYQGQQPYPQQQTAYGAQPVQPAPGLGGYQTAQPGQQTYQQQGAASYGGPPTSAYSPQPYGVGAMQNNSGMKGEVPAEVLNMGFNWGAMGLHWIWLCGNSMVAAGLGYFVGMIILNIALRMGLGLVAGTVVVIFLGLAVNIYLGMHGNRLAWRNRRFDSIEHFRAVRSAWTPWGVFFFILWVLFMIFTILTVIGMAALMSSNGAPPNFPSY